MCADKSLTTMFASIYKFMPSKKCKIAFYETTNKCLNEILFCDNFLIMEYDVILYFFFKELTGNFKY